MSLDWALMWICWNISFYKMNTAYKIRSMWDNSLCCEIKTSNHNTYWLWIESLFTIQTCWSVGWLSLPKLILFRFILSKSDLSWLAPSHKNIHGSNSLSSLNLTNLFSNTSSITISKIISKYEKDFQLCGYEDTLHQLQNLLHQKSSASWNIEYRNI